MKQLNDQWIYNSSYVIKQAILKAKESGIIDDGTIEKIIKLDLCNNIDSLCAQKIIQDRKILSLENEIAFLREENKKLREKIIRK